MKQCVHEQQSLNLSLLGLEWKSDADNELEDTSLLMMYSMKKYV